MNIDIKKAETCFAELLRRMADGSDIIITQEGEPVAKLVAVRKKQVKKRQFGSAQGLIRMTDDFDQTPDEFKEYNTNPNRRQPPTVIGDTLLP